MLFFFFCLKRNQLILLGEIKALTKAIKKFFCFRIFKNYFGIEMRFKCISYRVQSLLHQTQCH